MLTFVTIKKYLVICVPPEGASLASTTPRISAASPVSGVGVRPHGSNTVFSTPASTTRHILFSPLTPLLPTTTPRTALTSSYSSYLPTFSDTFHHSASSTTNTRSFLDDSPLIASVPPQLSKLSPPTSVHPFILLTTTAKSEVPIISTHPYPSSSGPFTPATSPVFTVTRIPSTPDTSTVFRLGPNVTINGQFLPVPGGSSSLTKLLLHNSGLVIVLISNINR